MFHLTFYGCMKEMKRITQKCGSAYAGHKATENNHVNHFIQDLTLPCPPGEEYDNIDSFMFLISTLMNPWHEHLTFISPKE